MFTKFVAAVVAVVIVVADVVVVDDLLEVELVVTEDAAADATDPGELRKNNICMIYLEIHYLKNIHFKD